MILQIKDLNAVTAILPHIIYSCLVIFKTLLLSHNKKEVWKILNTLKENFPTTDVLLVKYGTAKVLNRLKAFQKFYLFGYFGLFISFGVDPMIQMLKNGTKKFPIDIWLPFDGFQTGIYETVYILLTFVSISSISMLIATDLLFFAIIFLIVAELENIKLDFLEAADYPKMEMRTQYKTMMARHAKVLDVIKTTERIFSPVFLYNFLQSSILICVTGFQVSNATEFIQIFSFGSYFVTGMIQILLVCFCGQKIIDSSLAIADGIYEINWYAMEEKPLKDDLGFVILRAQKFSKLTAAKFATVSLESFTMILSSAFSYFTLLRTIWNSK